MTCKDCIHFDACLDNQGCGEFEFVTNVDYEDMKEWCASFRNKADFVEVVRCKDCKHRIKSPMADRVFCTIRGIKQNNSWYGTTAIDDNHFCSYGERSNT